MFDLAVIGEVLNEERLIVKGKHFSGNVVPNVHKCPNFSSAYDHFSVNQIINIFNGCSGGHQVVTKWSTSGQLVVYLWSTSGLLVVY